MDDLFYGRGLDYSGRVTITPVKCADGIWRWCVESFEDVQPDTPAFISSPSPITLFNTTDKMEHPWKDYAEVDAPLDLEDSDWLGEENNEPELDIRAGFEDDSWMWNMDKEE